MKLPLKLNNSNDIYYNCNKFYSYSNCFLGIIDGGRGIGKTTTFNIKGLQIANDGGQFIYLRRYKNEIKEFINKDSLSPILEGVAYKGDGAGGCTMLYEDTILGYCIPLTTARSYKSVDFSKVKLIIYDEAIVKQTPSYRYIQDECTVLLEFISTVVRTRTDVKVVILGNNEDIFNPYAAYFKLPVYEGIYVDKARGIYCEHAKNSPKLLELEKKTGLYNLVKGTTYGDYHYDNKLLTNAVVRLIDKPNDSKLLFRIMCNGQTVNIYSYNDKGITKLYCERREKVIDDNITYPLVDKGSPNYLYIDRYRKKVGSYLEQHYFNDTISYDDDRCGAIIKWVVDEI